MSISVTRHVWVLMVNGVQIGRWLEGGIVCLRFPMSVPDAIKEYLGRVARTWMVRSAAEMDKRKGK